MSSATLAEGGPDALACDGGVGVSVRPIPAPAGSSTRRANGLKLSQVDDYSFTFNYKQAGNLSGATPYARIFLDTNDDGATDADVILDPSLGGRRDARAGRRSGPSARMHDSVRYDDDAGAQCSAGVDRCQG